MKFILFTIFACIVCLSQKNGHVQGELLPGVGLVGRTISILYGLDPKVNLYNYTYEYNRTTPNEKYRIPDGFSYTPSISCDRSAYSFTTSSYSDFQKFKGRGNSIGGEFGKFSGSWSSSHKRAKREIQRSKTSVSYNEMICTQYRLQLLNYSFSIQSWFEYDAMQLPSTYTQQNKQRFINFIEDYGDHLITGCTVGGKLSSYAYTSEKYTMKNGQKEVTKEAKAAFFISIDHSSSKKYNVTKEFSQASEITDIKSLGGIYPDGDEHWIEWTRSIEALNNVECPVFTAVPITFIFERIEHLRPKSKAVHKALHDYFYSKRGCTDERAANFDTNALIDDGSCKILSCTTIPSSNVKAGCPSSTTSFISSMCISNSRTHCSNHYISEQCCKWTPKKKVSTRWIKGNGGQLIQCNAGEVAVGACGSGGRHHASHCEGGSDHMLQCAKTDLLVNRGDCVNVKGGDGQTIRCPAGQLAIGACQSHSKHGHSQCNGATGIVKCCPYRVKDKHVSNVSN